MAKRKILWVDDDEDLTLFLRPSLEKEGWQVKTASSAKQGKSIAVTDKPDLIIMDIIMEGEHGYRTIKELTNNPQLEDVPVIVFSSLTHRWSETTASQDDALRSNADEFVDKSAGIDGLISVIHEYLGT